MGLTRDLLNPHQRLALTITLRQVEKTLRSVLHDLMNEKQAVLYQSKMTLPEEKRLEVKWCSSAKVGLIQNGLKRPETSAKNRSDGIEFQVTDIAVKVFRMPIYREFRIPHTSARDYPCEKPGSYGLIEQHTGNLTVYYGTGCTEWL